MLREDAMDGGDKSLGRRPRPYRIGREKACLPLSKTIGAALVGSDQQGDSKDAIQPAVVDSHELATAAIAGIGGDILVVDDDPMNRETSLPAPCTRGL